MTPATSQPYSRREALDQPSHLAVADQQNPHQRQRRPVVPVRTQYRSEKRLVQPLIACGTSASRSTNVMFRRDAACDTSRSGMPLERGDRAANSVGSSCSRFSPTTQTIAISARSDARRSCRRLSTIVVEPARVVDRHRHAHLRRRHDVDRRLEALEHLEQPAQEAVRHQHARRGDVDHRHVALARERRQLTRRARPSAVISVPGFSGRRELRMRTGMFFATAGRIVLGCSTLAPKYASSDASANDSCGTSARLRRRRADRPSACRRRRSRSGSRRHRGRRRRSPPSSPIRRGRASS